MSTLGETAKTALEERRQASAATSALLENGDALVGRSTVVTDAEIGEILKVAKEAEALVDQHFCGREDDRDVGVESSASNPLP